MVAALSESTNLSQHSPSTTAKDSSLTRKNSPGKHSSYTPTTLTQAAATESTAQRSVRPSSSKQVLTVGNDTASPGGLLRKVKSLIVQISINFTLFFSKLRFLADQVLDSDEITGELFNRTDSTSIDSSLFESEGPEPAVAAKKMTITEEELSPDYLDNLDIQKEAQRLRELQDPAVPFAAGDSLWELQNKKWLLPLPENATINGRLKLQKRLQEKELKHVVQPKDYSIVYKSLVMDNKKLRSPMGLKDLLRVIDAGWHWNKTWEKAGQGGQQPVP